MASPRFVFVNFLCLLFYHNHRCGIGDAYYVYARLLWLVWIQFDTCRVVYFKSVVSVYVDNTVYYIRSEGHRCCCFCMLDVCRLGGPFVALEKYYPSEVVFHGCSIELGAVCCGLLVGVGYTLESGTYNELFAIFLFCEITILLAYKSGSIVVLCL